MVGHCATCAADVWPDTGACPRCLGPLSPRECPPEGRIAEVSRFAGGGGYFCLARFGRGVGLMGAVRRAPGGGARWPPRAGQRVRLEGARAGRGGRRSFDMVAAD